MSSYNEITLKDALQKLVKAYRIKGRLDQQRLIDSWEKVVGPMIAKHTRDIYLKDRKLIVMLSNATLRQELHYSKDRFCDLINEYLEEKAIDEVVLR